jgi:hypothetical protein
VLLWPPSFQAAPALCPPPATLPPPPPRPVTSACCPVFCALSFHGEESMHRCALYGMNNQLSGEAILGGSCPVACAGCRRPRRRQLSRFRIEANRDQARGHISHPKPFSPIIIVLCTPLHTHPRNLVASRDDVTRLGPPGGRARPRPVCPQQRIVWQGLQEVAASAGGAPGRCYSCRGGAA